MARYRGSGPRDAAEVIDNSQGRRGHNKRWGSPGHPRAHVSNPNATGPIDSIEQYSKTGPKSGFFTRPDQDLVVHEILRSSNGNTAMSRLNSGSTQEAITHGISELRIKAGDWRNGQFNYEFEPAIATLVLQHQQGMMNDPEADVHILTCYPNWR
ncbi:URB1 Hypothetical protein biogenesis 1 homolog (S. cerevisiae) [Nesidiocoris tenuis]|uniref:Uncharacterized protein n=1 Tax=Nesidiocoris tenuis TaxID=355587 RepID=A0ABN7AS20_9HEMI|nr:URB1 Hypothetical protein biogenesis 1 homolog (S. cerevisiae) [Nesidiocoris tenuis]